MNYCNVYWKNSPIAQPILVGNEQKYIQISTKIDVFKQMKPCRLLPWPIEFELLSPINFLWEPLATCPNLWWYSPYKLAPKLYDVTPRKILDKKPSPNKIGLTVLGCDGRVQHYISCFQSKLQGGVGSDKNISNMITALSSLTCSKRPRKVSQIRETRPGYPVNFAPSLKLPCLRVEMQIFNAEK